MKQQLLLAICLAAAAPALATPLKDVADGLDAMDGEEFGEGLLGEGLVARQADDGPISSTDKCSEGAYENFVEELGGCLKEAENSLQTAFIQNTDIPRAYCKSITESVRE